MILLLTIAGGDDGGDQFSGEQALLTLSGGCIWLMLVTTLIAILSELLTDTLQGASASWGVRRIY